MKYSDKYLAFMGKWPRRIPHWEHWSNPDAETYMTGIDYYKHPRLCRQKMAELYPQLELSIPETDTSRQRPLIGKGDISSTSESHTVRWGDGETATWVHGEAFFKDEEDVFAFSPLENPDFSRWPHVIMDWDFSSEEVIYQRLIKDYTKEHGFKAPEGSTRMVSYYNTMFMWPILTFGWELFLQCCQDERFERIMGEFAEINRRVFKAFARLPVNFVVCHDDIVTSRGPVCSPQWMKKNIFPRYEEFWSIVKAAGKEVIFMADGCMDKYVDDIMARGARGIISEPYTDYKKIASKYADCFLAGEGDTRILMRNDKDEIKAMVENMVLTSKICGGYMMCIGNHIPWNVPPEAIKRYLGLSVELAHR